MGKTLTWSEGSHSDRFLQGRDEFSFSSQVPSKVQKRYTCPCSTARSKMSHTGSAGGEPARPRGKAHRVVCIFMQLSLLTHRSPGWRGKLQHGRGSAAPAPCLPQHSAACPQGRRAAAKASDGSRTCSGTVADHSTVTRD